MAQPVELPAYALLANYRASGAYTDCYAVRVAGEVSLAEFIEAFYTTRLFKLERWILSSLLNRPSTDEDAAQLATGMRDRFAAWKVEARSESEILLDAGQTRSWLCVARSNGELESTQLCFGSAVLPLGAGKGFGWWFHALLGFHRVYSRLLLSAAARRVLVLRNR